MWRVAARPRALTHTPRLSQQQRVSHRPPDFALGPLRSSGAIESTIFFVPTPVAAARRRVDQIDSGHAGSSHERPYRPRYMRAKKVRPESQGWVTAVVAQERPQLETTREFDASN